MNKLSTFQKIKHYMESKPKGTVFATRDFIEFGSSTAIRKTLSELVRDGFCKRIVPGIFYTPYYSKTLNKEVLPLTDDFAKAIARNYEWKIVPSPVHAQNGIGISTQVPSKAVYTSTGPTREYFLGNLKVTFKHSGCKFMSSMSYTSAYVTNALYGLSERFINEDTIQKISDNISLKDKEVLKDELFVAPKWLQPYLKEICKN